MAYRNHHQHHQNAYTAKNEAVGGPLEDRIAQLESMLSNMVQRNGHQEQPQPQSQQYGQYADPSSSSSRSRQVLPQADGGGGGDVFARHQLHTERAGAPSSHYDRQQNNNAYTTSTTHHQYPSAAAAAATVSSGGGGNSDPYAYLNIPSAASSSSSSSNAFKMSQQQVAGVGVGRGEEFTTTTQQGGLHSSRRMLPTAALSSSPTSSNSNFSRPPPLPTGVTHGARTLSDYTMQRGGGDFINTQQQEQQEKRQQLQLQQAQQFQIKLRESKEANQQQQARIAELESALSIAKENAAAKDLELRQVKASLESLRNKLGDAELRVAAAISSQKGSETAALAAQLSAKQEAEAAEKSANIWWGTVQALRSAFDRQEAQVSLIKKEERISTETASAKAIRVEVIGSGGLRHLLGARERPVGGAGGQTFAREVDPTSSGARPTVAGAVPPPRSDETSETTGKIGQKRARDTENNTKNGGHENQQQFVFAPVVRPPKGVASLMKLENANPAVRNGNNAGQTVSSYSYYDEDNDVAYYSKYQHTPNNTKNSSALQQKKKGAAAAGKTPRTPSVTGAEKLALRNQQLGYPEEEESMSSVYKGPKGVSQLSGGYIPSQTNSVFSSIGRHAQGAAVAATTGRAPPSPAPKPTSAAVAVASNSNKVLGVGTPPPITSKGKGGGTTVTGVKNEDLSPVLDFNSNYNKNNNLGGDPRRHQQRGGADREEGSVGTSVANTSLGGLSSLRSHTKLTSVRKEKGGGFTTRSPTPTNPTRGADTDRRFVLSGVSEEDKRLITAAVKQLGRKGVVVDGGIDQPPPPSCTHVVIPGMPQSFKALCGLVSCRWLITPQYIFDSLAAGFWLNEEDCNHVRCHPPPLAHQRFLVSLPQQQQGGGGQSMTPEMRAMKERLEYVIRFGDGIVVEEGSASASASGVVIIQSGDDIFNYCLRPQH